MAALKPRLSDANKVVLKGYVEFMGHLARAMGKEIKTYGYLYLNRKTLLNALI
jgi:hypothetical protein